MEDSNRSSNPTIHEISDPARRIVLLGGGGAALAAAFGPLAGCAVAPAPAPAARPTLGFASVPPSRADRVVVPPGYRVDVIAPWGEPVGVPGAMPAWRPDAGNSAAEQALQLGMHHDAIHYVALEGSRRGLLVINHEYTDDGLLHPGGMQPWTAEKVAKSQAAHGLSVIEVTFDGSRWQLVRPSRYARRFTATTPFAVAGPAAGHALMKTAADPAGRRVLGTLNNCAAGLTPWGTVLSGEENWNGYFFPADQPTAHERRWGIRKNHWYRWHEHDLRFDTVRHPNEPNRFGWIVEIDPYDPAAMPKKRTAMGRFKHENAAIVAEPGKPVVAYMGDDESGEFLYRFISKGIYEPANRAANMNLLEDGTLSCAQFAKDGTGRWLKMTAGEGPLVPANRIQDAADVLIDARRAARLLEATPMDRPEDAEVSPVTGKVFIALTSHNSRREKIPASSRGPNPYGHILEIVPPGEDGGRDHWADHFTWNLFIEAGDPSAGDDAMKPAYGGVIDPSGWFANPDNLAFDPKGRLWIATDGANDFGIADGLWAVVTEGEGRAVPRAFFACPRGAEACGPCFTPDGRTLFVAVQHPADETGSTFDAPSTRWPDFDPALPPRPAVVVITKDDGGAVGG